MTQVSGRIHKVPPILAAIAAVLTFAICIRNDFSYDDVTLLMMDDRLADPSQWTRYWSESYNGGVDNLYRPMVSMTYAVQHAMHGLTRWPYFAVNIALHAAVSAAVAVLALRLRSPASFATVEATVAGVLFATHPVHSEVVAGVVGRAESMCALFFLSAMILLTRPLTPRRAVAIWACAGLALLSKEQGLLLPLVLAMQRLLIVGRKSTSSRDRRGLIALALLICWTWTAYIVFRENTLRFWWPRSMLDAIQQPLVLAEPLDRVLMPIALLGRYVALLVVPANLSLDYGGKVIGHHVTAGDPYLWIGVITLVLWILAIVLAIRFRKHTTIFLLACLTLTYLVISNAFTLIGTNFGERLIYLPSAFFFILVGRAMRAWLSNYGDVYLTLGLLAVLCSARTFLYVRFFDDRLRLYGASAAMQPESVRIRMLLSTELLARRMLEDAALVASDARRIEPDYHEVYILSAAIELERGDLEQADAFLKRAAAAPSIKSRPLTKVSVMMERVAKARAATQPQ